MHGRSISLTFPLADRRGTTARVVAEGPVGNVWIKSLSLKLRDGRTVEVLARGARTTVDL